MQQSEMKNIRILVIPPFCCDSSENAEATNYDEKRRSWKYIESRELKLQLL